MVQPAAWDLLHGRDQGPSVHHGLLPVLSCGLTPVAPAAPPGAPHPAFPPADCALDMIKRYSLGTAACPFCRALVAAFRPATLEEMRQH